MRLTCALAVLAATVPMAFADPEITIPAAGATIPAGPGGAVITVTWTDSGDAPSIADLTSYQLFLYSGSNTVPQQLWAAPGGAAPFTPGNTVSVTVPPGTGGATLNAYFFQLISTAKAGGTVTTYSNRFTLSGMTGTFAPAITAALATVVGTAGPPKVNNVANAAPQPPAAGQPATDAGAWGVPYNLQTGTVRYAPMQQTPGTAITATNTAPLFSSSAVVLASTFLPIPSVITTMKQPPTGSVITSHANTASAASQPTNDMQRFLNRWKD